MKILFTYTGFLPAVAWGGPVSVIHQNALELKKRGHTITVCASNLLDKHSRIGTGSFEKDIDGIRVVYLNTYLFSNWPGSLGPTFLSLNALKILWNEVKKTDVLHVNGVRNIFAVLALLFAGLNRRPVVLQPHGTFPHIVNSIWLKRWFDWLVTKPLLNFVSLFIALQKAEEQQIIDAGGGSERIRIVPNGLNTTDYKVEQYRSQFRMQYHIPNNIKIILFLGRINYKKGTDLLVEAFALLSNTTRRNTKLVIAGPDDGQLAEVRALVSKYNLQENVMLTGLLSGDDVYKAHADADIFILPCRTDTFPMAILEACQAETPMIISETCEIADVLANKVATITSVEPVEIAQAITDLLENEELQTHYRQNCRTLMETEFSISAVGDKLENIYEEVVHNA